MDKLSDVESNSVITIGNFDGIHRGHQKIFSRMREIDSSQTTVIAFDPHPEELLMPEEKIEKLSSTKQKKEMIKNEDIDNIVLLPFDKEIASLSAREFLEKTRPAHLILGEDATFGKNRDGCKKTVAQLAKELNFKFEYIEKMSHEKSHISSTRIRKEVRKGNLDLVEKLLGRKYSIEGKIISDKKIVVDISHACTPPDGIYVVEIVNESPILGIAHLKDKRLSVHSHTQIKSIPKSVEIVFYRKIV